MSTFNLAEASFLMPIIQEGGLPIQVRSLISGFWYVMPDCAIVQFLVIESQENLV